ncbi:MAG: transposase [Bacteroidales bacterium]|nr:transposase [Bacteroidales bacterium]
MSETTLLLPNKHYHIYNRGINSENIFREPDNYQFFLQLYQKHIVPYIDTFAWVLMPNHFHLLVKIKEPIPNRFPKPVRYDSKPPHQYFSNMFNAYTKSFNNRYERHGTLFERAFKRKEINEEAYFMTLVRYIHNNPVHHGLTNRLSDYPWSSYNSCLSDKPTNLKRNDVLDWFDGVDNFKSFHQRMDDVKTIDEFVGI